MVAGLDRTRSGTRIAIRGRMSSQKIARIGNSGGPIRVLDRYGAGGLFSTQPVDFIDIPASAGREVLPGKPGPDPTR